MRESKRNEAVIIAAEQGYKVLDDGRVLTPTNTIRKASPDRLGYLKFTITDAGETLTVMVHKLVAFQQFGGLIFDEDKEIRHLDDDKSNNSKDNISFGSHSANMMDIDAANRIHNSRYGTAATRKLSAAQVREIRALSEDGWTVRRLAAKYGIGATTVCNLVNRKTYNDV
jgi:hypothetical protein